MKIRADLVALISIHHAFPGEIADELLLTRDVVDVHSEHIIFAEALVHELCHAAVFKIDVFPLGKLMGAVSRCFDEIKKSVPNKVNPNRPAIVSDITECAALAVEKMVLEKCAWPINWEMLVSLACDDMKFLSAVDVDRHIAKKYTYATTVKRARRVLKWLKTITEMASLPHYRPLPRRVIIGE